MNPLLTPVRDREHNLYVTTTSKPNAKTTRIPNAFASAGAVRQNGGSLPVYQCNTCGAEVVWATSARTGRKYLANVRRGQMDQRFYIGSEIHPRDCGEAFMARRVESLTEIVAQEINSRLAAWDGAIWNAFQAGILDDETATQMSLEVCRFARIQAKTETADRVAAMVNR